MGLASGREIRSCCCCCRDAEIAWPYGELWREREREKILIKVTLTQKTHVVLVDSSGSWNSSQVWSQGSSQEVGEQDKYYEVTLSKFFRMSWFQTTFLLFTANPPSPLKIKEGNRTDGVRIFLVCLSAGKVMYIYKYPSCQPRKGRWTVLFAPVRHYPFAELTPHRPFLGAHSWSTEIPPSGSLPMNTNGSPPLQSSIVKGRELSHELQTLPGAESLLHCSTEGKTSHQHTRTEGSTLKSRHMVFRQRFFNLAFNKEQCMLHCHCQTTQQQKCYCGPQEGERTVQHFFILFHFHFQILSYSPQMVI